MLLRGIYNKDMGNVRYNNISLLRLISTLFIFAFHAVLVLFPDTCNNFFPLYFTVDAFLFISGLLYSMKPIDNVKNFYFKNILKLLIPTLFLMLFDMIGCLIVNPSIVAPQNLFPLMFAGQTIALGHLWYIIYMTFCYMLLPLLHITLNKEHRYYKLAKTIVILVLVAEAGLMFFTPVMNVFLSFYFGFYFGSKLTTRITPPSSSRKIGALAFIIFAVTTAIYVVLYQFATPTSTFATDAFLCGIHYLVAIMALSFSVWFLNLFAFLNNRQTGWFLRFCDRYSFSFYLAHHIMLVNTLSLLYITPYTLLNVFISFCTSLALAVILYWVSNPPTNWLISKIVKRKVEQTPQSK